MKLNGLARNHALRARLVCGARSFRIVAARSLVIARDVRQGGLATRGPVGSFGNGGIPRAGLACPMASVRGRAGVCIHANELDGGHRGGTQPGTCLGRWSVGRCMGGVGNREHPSYRPGCCAAPTDRGAAPPRVEVCDPARRSEGRTLSAINSLQRGRTGAHSGTGSCAIADVRLSPIFSFTTNSVYTATLLLGIMTVTMLGVTFLAWRLGNEKRAVALLGTVGGLCLVGTGVAATF